MAWNGLSGLGVSLDRVVLAVSKDFVLLAVVLDCVDCGVSLDLEVWVIK